MVYKDIVMIFIIGASGAGKTSVLYELERLYGDSLSCFYFDDIGVPLLDEMVERHGSGENWQKWATEQWIERLVNMQRTNIVVLEGSFNPAFAVDRLHELGIKKYLFICLDVERKIREQRLITERNQPELVTDDMQSFAEFLKQTIKDLGGIVIDVNHNSIGQIAQKIYAHIQQLL